MKILRLNFFSTCIKNLILEHLEILMIYFHNFGIKNKVDKLIFNSCDCMLYKWKLFKFKIILFIKYNAYGCLNKIIKSNRKIWFD